jgi:hypothetical protein
MIWIDEVEAPFTRAINALNYDKRGHETGLGSNGIRLVINDGFEEPLILFLGIKFDVISIITNRYITSFINIPRELKNMCAQTKEKSRLGNHVSGISNFTPDIEADTVIEFYVDIHKVSLDVVELLKQLYTYVDTTEEYVALSKDKVFLTKGRKAARGVSANMSREYDGNLENFGFIFTRNTEDYLLNEMIVPDERIADEIRYTFWLTPHDREEYDFLRNHGAIRAEAGDEIVSSMGHEFSMWNETDKLYKYDRRMMRHGYYDVLAGNPLVNYGNTEGSMSLIPITEPTRPL